MEKMAISELIKNIKNLQEKIKTTPDGGHKKTMEMNLEYLKISLHKKMIEDLE